MELLLCQWTQQTGRDPGHHGVGGNVLGDNGAGGHNGAVTDGDPREHRGVGADPDPITDDDGSWVEPGAPGGRGVVVQGGQDHIVADEDAVADGNAPLVLEPTAGVEKDLFPKGEVLPAVGGKGGEQGKAFVHRFADELGEQGADLLGRMVPSVQHAGDGQGLLAELVHELMNGRASLHGETPVEMI